MAFKYARIGALAFGIGTALGACGQQKHSPTQAASVHHEVSKRVVSAEANLGCGDDVCVKWTNVTRRVIFKTTIGDFVEVRGTEVKQLSDGSEKSVPEIFHYSALCSKSMPAMTYTIDGKMVVDWLSPNNTDGVFGYNQSDYAPYLETCSSIYGQNLAELSEKLGYSVDPQFVNQVQFSSLQSLGEAIGDEALKRGFEASLIGTCEINVAGKVYSNGRCHISITSLQDTKTIVITDILNGYFACINTDGENRDSAKGYWNGVDKGDHAQDELGTLKRAGACWANEKAKLCYRWLTP